MKSLLNKERPPLFCPGCDHDRVVKGLDVAMGKIGLAGNEVVLVTDIGCCGLFDTFFNTHAMHGLHGRALTYGTGLKMARPELQVIVIMGDGGLGIGGAHLLSSCRKNLDLTLLVLNNFNYGMTGGQCSVTTPADGETSSGFLNTLEPPLDICTLASAAGAPWVARSRAREESLPELLAEALGYHGFSLLEVQGVCPGRYSRKNRSASAGQSQQGWKNGVVANNQRPEYGTAYRTKTKNLPEVPGPLRVGKKFPRTFTGRRNILILGAAGQRITTAGELLCLAAMTSGAWVSQKSDYPITVLRGHSLSEVIVADEQIGFTGVDRPDCIIALDQVGVDRRPASFARVGNSGLVLCAAEVKIPPTKGRVVRIDFSGDHGVSPADRALCSLGLLAMESDIISLAMLGEAIQYRFSGKQLTKAREILSKFAANSTEETG